MEEKTTEQSQAPAETTPSTPSPDESLKSIASEFPVEEQAKQFTAQPQPQYQPQYQQPVYQPEQFAPDPVTNPEGYKMFMQAQWQQGQNAQTELRKLSEQFTNFQKTIEEQRTNAEVDAAVTSVNSKLKVDPTLAEALLNVEYKQNPSFKHIWDNRHKNPQAFKNALNVLGDKLHSKVQVRQDPQLAENVRAAQTSQRTMATTKTPTQTEGWDNLSDSEFQKKWQEMVRGV